MKIEEQLFWDIQKQIGEELDLIQEYKKENYFLSAGEEEELERRIQELQDMNEGAAYILGLDYEGILKQVEEN